MKTFLKATALLSALTMLLATAACGQGGQSGGVAPGGDAPAPASQSKTESAPAEKPAEGETTEITISHFYIEEQRKTGADNDAFYTMLAKYEGEHPEIKITQSVLEQADYHTKIQAQAAVNEVPDIFLVKGSWFNNFVSNDLLAPLDDYLNAYEKKDSFRSGIFDASTVKGKNYGMPTQYAVTSVVYYNAPMWAEIGYDAFPDSWEGIYDAIDKFNAKGVTPFAFGNRDKWPAESCILSALGDRYTGVEWTNSIIANDGKAKFTDPEFIKALEHLGKLAEKKAFNPDFNAIQNNPADEYYCAGNAAACIEGWWNLTYILENATDEVKEVTKVALLPPVEGGKGKAKSTSGGCGWYMGMSNALEGAKRDICGNLLIDLFSYDNSEYIVSNYGTTAPCVTGEVDTTQFPKLTQEYLQAMEGVEMTPIYDILMEGAVIETMNSNCQEILNGTKDAATAAAEIQAEQEKVVK